VTRVLLIGGSGRLGTAIRQGWTDCEIIAPSHSTLPLEAAEALDDALRRVRPDVLVNAAAFHDVDRCEEERDRAFTVNAFAVGQAARLARQYDAAFMTMSTDYVFDGTTSRPYSEDATPRPLSIYGISKLTGEYLAEHDGGRAFVVRTCGLYGISSAPARPSLIERALQAGEDRAPLRVVDDVYAAPTFAGDLAAALRRLLKTEAFGLYHAVNVGPVSWYDFARTAIELAGKEAVVEPIDAGEWKTAAVRPRFSALENARLRALHIEMPSWQDGIAAYLQTLLD
jgi:dTDP-4-dehydrorhamnose reductase